MKVFLIGMMGAGKSSIGLILSKKLGWSFFDTDQLIDVKSYLVNHDMGAFRLEETKQINKIPKRTNLISLLISNKNLTTHIHNKCLGHKSTPIMIASRQHIIPNNLNTKISFHLNKQI